MTMNLSVLGIYQSGQKTASWVILELIWTHFDPVMAISNFEQMHCHFLLFFGRTFIKVSLSERITKTFV